jgi:small conductance mechanosensitive channel
MEEQLAEVQKYYDVILTFLVTYSFKILGALIVFLIGLWIAGKAGNWLRVFSTKHGVDASLANLFGNVLKVVLLLMVGIMSLSQLGISVTPFVAAVGAASLGAGLAFQGLLSNYGAGLTIILTGLFHIGDTIRVQGVFGVVKEITLGYTLVENEDGELITIPNRHVVGEIVHNSADLRIVEGEVGVAYSSDMNKALAVVESAVKSTEHVSQQPQPQIGIDRFDDSGITIGFRVWVPSLQYFGCKYRMNRAVLNALQDAQIQIPFPQREVKIIEAPGDKA